MSLRGDVNNGVSRGRFPSRLFVYPEGVMMHQAVDYAGPSVVSPGRWSERVASGVEWAMLQVGHRAGSLGFLMLIAFLVGVAADKGYYVANLPLLGFILHGAGFVGAVAAWPLARRRGRFGWEALALAVFNLVVAGAIAWLLVGMRSGEIDELLLKLRVVT